MGTKYEVTFKYIVLTNLINFTSVEVIIDTSVQPEVYLTGNMLKGIELYQNILNKVSLLDLRQIVKIFNTTHQPVMNSNVGRN